jgi:hypothetical protein
MLDIAINNAYNLALAALIVFSSLILFRVSTITATNGNVNLKNLLLAIIISVVASNVIVWTSYNFQEYPFISLCAIVLFMILTHYSFYYFVKKFLK